MKYTQQQIYDILHSNNNEELDAFKKFIFDLYSKLVVSSSETDFLVFDIYQHFKNIALSELNNLNVYSLFNFVEIMFNFMDYDAIDSMGPIHLQKMFDDIYDNNNNVIFALDVINKKYNTKISERNFNKLINLFLKHLNLSETQLLKIVDLESVRYSVGIDTLSQLLDKHRPPTFDSLRQDLELNVPNKILFRIICTFIKNIPYNSEKSEILVKFFSCPDFIHEFNQNKGFLFYFSILEESNIQLDHTAHIKALSFLSKENQSDWIKSPSFIHLQAIKESFIKVADERGLISLNNINDYYNIQLPLNLYQYFISYYIYHINDATKLIKFIKSRDFTPDNKMLERIKFIYEFLIGNIDNFYKDFIAKEFNEEFSEVILNNLDQELDHKIYLTFINYLRSKLALSENSLTFNDYSKIYSCDDSFLFPKLKTIILKNILIHNNFNLYDLNKFLESEYDLTAMSLQNIEVLLDYESIEVYTKIKKNPYLKEIFRKNRSNPYIIKFILIINEYSQDELEQAVAEFLNTYISETNNPKYIEKIRNLIFCKRFLVAVNNLITSDLGKKINWFKICNLIKITVL